MQKLQKKPLRIFISTIPFGEVELSPLQVLDKSGFEYNINPLGRKLKADEVAEIAKDYDALIAGTEDTTPLIQSSKKLKIISRVGIGLDSIPLELCKKKGITVCYTPDAVTKAVAEFTVGLMLDSTRHITHADRNQRAGVWKRLQGKRIGESVIGLVGYGRVGSMITGILSSFKPKQIFVNDLKDKHDEIRSLSERSGVEIKQVEKEIIWKHADVISLHVPFSKLTKDMIGKEEMKMMKSETVLINTARGGIINEEELCVSLIEKQIASAALDVFKNEPYEGKLNELDNILLTQHMGSCSYDCRTQMELEAVEEVIRFFKQEPLLREVPEEELQYQKA
jgi:D-3-phosphoglycerate dehydrogenase / 2-oxoglutarate reductase